MLRDFLKSYIILSLPGIHIWLCPCVSEYYSQTQTTDLSLTTNIIKYLYLQTFRSKQIVKIFTFVSRICTEKWRGSTKSCIHMHFCKISEPRPEVWPCREWAAVQNTKLATRCPQPPLPSPSATLWLLLWVSHHRPSLQQRVGKGVCNSKSWGEAEEMFHRPLN